MKTWQKLALIVLIPAAILAIGIWRINVRRHEQAVAVPQKSQGPTVTQDEAVMPRKLYIDSLESAQALVGKPVWMQAGYEFRYYPYRDGHVEFAHSEGVLPSVQRLDIHRVTTQKVPAKLESRVPHGDKQVFAVFTMPGDAHEYATAIGYIQGSDSTYYCDQMFYYDNPHTLYYFWPAKIWQAIDQHQAIAGMNPLQVSMAVGVIEQSNATDPSNGTVNYIAGPTTWEVNFENGKATQVKQEKTDPANSQ